VRSARTHRRRERGLPWFVAGVGLTIFAVYEILVHDLWPLPLVVFALLPDITLLAAARDTVRRRQSPGASGAVAAYEIAHQPLLALAVIALAIGALLAARMLNHAPEQFETARRIPLYCFTGGVVWLGHIAYERAFDFARKVRNG
jgi:hypothetical protein